MSAELRVPLPRGHLEVVVADPPRHPTHVAVAGQEAASEAAGRGGGNSIEDYWLEVWLCKSLEFWLSNQFESLESESLTHVKLKLSCPMLAQVFDILNSGKLVKFIC